MKNTSYLSFQLLFLLFLIVYTPLFSNGQTYEWGKAFGGSANDFGLSVASDNQGNVYTTGYYGGTVDFDPNAGVNNITATGNVDIFIQKLDVSGNLVWAKSLAGNNVASGLAITADGSGNVIVTGFFRGTVDFDPGANTFNLTATGNSDFYILKLDTQGNFLWALSFEGDTEGRGIALETDNAENIYVTGTFEGTVDFDPTAGVNQITSQGSRDAFLLKLDPAGNLLWNRILGGTSFVVSRGIDVSATGGTLVLTGYFEGVVDLDPGPGTSNFTSVGSYNAFIVKLDGSGNYSWGTFFEGNGENQGESIALDNNGNIYTVGYFDGTIDLNTDAGVEQYTTNVYSDYFIHKLDPSGNFLWAERFGDGATNDFAESIDIDDYNNLYISGSFAGGIDFDPGAGSAYIGPNGGFDVFIQKLDASGNFIWVTTYGGTSSERSHKSTVDQLGNVFSAGYFTNTTDLDPTPNTDNYTSNGSNDIFVHRISQCLPTTATDVHTACDSYTWIDGNTYTSSNNTATFTLTNTAGCDSIVTLDLTINNSTTGTDIITACDSYQWIDGNTYTSSNNTATFTLTNTAGCDSIVTLDLTINNSTTGTDVIAACGSYQWIDGNTYTSSNNTATFTLTNTAGCDSIVTLDLTINNSTTGTDVITACDSYQWIDGNTYTSSNNTATFTLTNAAGCDSIVTLDLTINNSTTGTDVITACDSYQWIDGNTYTASNNTATFTLTNAAGCDSIVTLDLTINNSTTGTDVITACDSYQWIDGNTYTASNNTATFTLTNAVGCDSIVTLDLTINNSTTGTDVITACDSYQWIDGNTYTSSNNTATFTLTNTAGCDSIVTLDLTINNSTTGTDVITACDSYQWIDGNTYTASNNTATFTLTNAAGCDSIVTLDLTINNSTTGTDVITACDSYQWIDGNTYTASNNTATFTLTNAAGCDSIVTLDLTINSVSDLTTTTSEISITANNANASYQWLDCDNNYAVISGETGQQFTASANGNYAVELTENGCVDTSDCVAITTVGIGETNFANKVAIYPNPTNGEFSVDLGAIYENVQIIITDVAGKQIQAITTNQSQLIDITMDQPTGIYMVSITANTNKTVIRLVKN